MKFDWLWLLIIAIFILLIIAIAIVLANNIQTDIMFAPTYETYWLPCSKVSASYDLLNTDNLAYKDPNDVQLYMNDYYSELIKGDDQHNNELCDVNPLYWRKYQYNHNEVWHFSASYINKPTNERKVIFFCHGNSGNISQRRYIVEMAIWFEMDVVIFDYRGFGNSTGKATAYNICTDAQEVYYWLCQRYANKNIVVWGESVGGAPATYVAQRNKVGKLLLFSTFSGLDDVAASSHSDHYMTKLMVVIERFVNLLPTKQWIVDISCPTLIIHSPDDKLIDLQQAKTNYEACGSKEKKLLYISGGHSSPNMSVSSVQQIYSFINDGAELPLHKAYFCRKLVRRHVKDLMTWYPD